MSKYSSQVAGATGQILVNNTTWTEAKVGSTRLQDRAWLLIQNKADGKIAFTTDTSKNFKESIEIGIGQMVQIPVTSAYGIYVKTKTSAGRRVVVMELS